MELVTSGDTEEGSKSVGRKNSQGAPAVFKPKLLKELCPDLITTFTKIKNQNDRFKDSVTAVAEKAGCSSANVMKYIRANVGDNFAEKKADAEQLYLIFEDAKQIKT